MNEKFIEVCFSTHQIGLNRTSTERLEADIKYSYQDHEKINQKLDPKINKSIKNELNK